MCHLYHLRIKTHVLTSYHALHYRATWWQLGLNSKEDICVSLCQLLVSAGGAGPLSDSQHSHTATSSSCGKQVCSSEEVHYGSARSTAGDGGNSDTRTTPRLYHSIKRETYRSCQWLLESLDLGSLCWLIFGGKSTECGKFKAG